MSVNVRSDLIQGSEDTCRECPAPITQPASGGRKVFCDPCIVRRRAQRSAERLAALTPKEIAAQNQAKREQTAKLSPEKRAARAQYLRKYRAARTPEQIDARAQWHAARYVALSPEAREARTRQERESRLQRKYRIGVAEFDALLAAQGDRCAICGADVPNGYGWHVDHDHKTGAVRGILCSGCNIGIGHLKDDPAILRAATAYLESYPLRRAS